MLGGGVGGVRDGSGGGSAGTVRRTVNGGSSGVRTGRARSGSVGRLRAEGVGGRDRRGPELVGDRLLGRRVFGVVRRGPAGNGAIVHERLGVTEVRPGILVERRADDGRPERPPRTGGDHHADPGPDERCRVAERCRSRRTPSRSNWRRVAERFRLAERCRPEPAAAGSAMVSSAVADRTSRTLSPSDRAGSTGSIDLRIGVRAARPRRHAVAGRVSGLRRLIGAPVRLLGPVPLAGTGFGQLDGSVGVRRHGPRWALAVTSIGAAWLRQPGRTGRSGSERHWPLLTSRGGTRAGAERLVVGLTDHERCGRQDHHRGHTAAAGGRLQSDQRSGLGGQLPRFDVLTEVAGRHPLEYRRVLCSRWFMREQLDVAHPDPVIDDGELVAALPEGPTVDLDRGVRRREIRARSRGTRRAGRSRSITTGPAIIASSRLPIRTPVRTPPPRSSLPCTTSDTLRRATPAAASRTRRGSGATHAICDAFATGEVIQLEQVLQERRVGLRVSSVLMKSS